MVNWLDVPCPLFWIIMILMNIIPMQEITGDYTFNTHTDDGDVLYGIDVFIKSKFRGLRLGRRLYDYRKELCERLESKRHCFWWKNTKLQ